MKGIVLLVLIGSMSWPSFADDARELPKGTLRLSQSTSFAFAVSEFNLDGEKVGIPQNGGRVVALNLGAALEMAITDWVSALLEWTPGWTVWSAFDFQTTPDDMLTVNGGYDLFAATRVKVLGPGALLPSNRFRLAFAPGGVIPLPSPDWQEQANRALDGEHWRQYANDYHTPGLGSRGYFDLILSDWFRLNLYGEFIRYFPKDYDEVDLLAYQMLPPKPREVDFGYALTGGVEPCLEFDLGGMRIGASLPLAYRKTPELEFDGTAVANSDTYLLAVGPSLTLFFAKPALETIFTYTYPILGKGLNTPAMNSLSLQVRSYLRHFK